MLRLGRNDPCYCGSGQKYKNCHLPHDAAGDKTSHHDLRLELDKSLSVPASTHTAFPTLQSWHASRHQQQSTARPAAGRVPNEILDSHRAVLDAIGRLPPPRAGYARVYRGQTGDFGKMLPSGLRPSGLRSKTAFRVYSLGLAEALRAAAGHAPLPATHENWDCWTQAIAQHYGPGSDYLDVTRSLDVALWFALHQAKSLEYLSLYGLPGPFDPENDVASSETWTEYHDTAAQHGWLYVFDVPLWTGDKLPGHGELVDLSRAHPTFADSPRIQAQHACLIRAEQKVDSGDLSSRYACEPFAISSAMKTASGPALSAERLFPCPSRDDWYARFLAIPLVPGVDQGGRLHHGQAVPVAIHRYESEDINKDVRQRLVMLTPHVVFPTAIEMLAESRKAGHWQGDFAPAEATPILLASPILRTLPVGRDDFFNHRLLLENVADTVQTFDVDCQISGLASLKNVFLEFSPLERIGWENLEREGFETDFLRGLWLIRQGPGVMVHLLYHLMKVTEPASILGPARVEQRLQLHGPLYLDIDSRTRRFRMRVAEDAPAIERIAGAENPIIAALMILRELSDLLKVSAVPMVAGEGKGTWGYVAKFRHAAARLLKAHDSRSGRDFYILTALRSNEPFEKPEEAVGAVSLKTKRTWPDVDPTDLRTLMLDEILRAAKSMPG
jgi:hypothetical protein